jgi:hypothetical protein
MNNYIIGFEKVAAVRAIGRGSVVRKMQAVTKRPGLAKRQLSNWYKGKVPGGTLAEKYKGAANAPRHKVSKAVGKGLLGAGAVGGAAYGASKLLNPKIDGPKKHFNNPTYYA